jgi:hypothetical protein
VPTTAAQRLNLDWFDHWGRELGRQIDTKFMALVRLTPRGRLLVFHCEFGTVGKIFQVE